MAMNWLATLNGLTLSALYLFILGSTMGWITKDYNIIFIPLLAIGLVSEIIWVVKQFMKR